MSDHISWCEVSIHTCTSFSKICIFKQWSAQIRKWRIH